MLNVTDWNSYVVRLTIGNVTANHVGVFHSSLHSDAMAQAKTVQLKIGNRRYPITSDDAYLRQMRDGQLNAVNNKIRALLGIDHFEPRMARLFSTLIQKEDVVLDVGANIGCTALLFSQLARRVISFEPVPSTFNLWKKNIEASGENNISGWNWALGAEQKVSAIAFSEANRSGAFVMDKTQSGAGQTSSIEVKRLDDVVVAEAIDQINFVKLDVEGYEHHVIEGGWQSIQRHRPVIELEVNAWCLNVQQRISLPDFFDFLLERFPVAYAIQGQQFVDIRQSAGRWHVMEQNILKQRFKEMVVAFDQSRLQRFFKAYQEIKF